jgi:hypothetical protein
MTLSAPSGGESAQLGGSTSQPSRGPVGDIVGDRVGFWLGELEGVKLGHSPQDPSSRLD